MVKSYRALQSSEWSVLPAFIAIFISRHARIPGWKRLSRRSRPVHIIIGTNASPRSATVPNGALRILDSQHRISKIVNNYSRISFNFGPTLLSWMEERAPDGYQRILDGDRESRQFSVFLLSSCSTFSFTHTQWRVTQ